MKILGIDPALSITGYGVIELANNRISLIDAGIVETKAISFLPERLESIYNGIVHIVKKFSPECVVLEKVYVHAGHKTTAFILGQAYGVICLISAQNNLPLFEYAATRVKKIIVGAGSASKDQIQRMVVNTLGLIQIPKYKDVTDALALAIAHCYVYKSEQKLKVLR